MKSSDEEDNRKYMEDHKEGLRELLELFSNRRKPEREVWVVNELLNYLGLERLVEGVKASDDDPPDVRFRAAAIVLAMCFSVCCVERKQASNWDGGR